jgi:hypothetical protein
MNLTADEITTFAEVFGTELTLAQMTHLEEWVDAHRDQAVVEADLRTLVNNGRLRSALQRTEANFIAAVNGKPVRDMSETLAENRAALKGFL